MWIKAFHEHKTFQLNKCQDCVCEIGLTEVYQTFTETGQQKKKKNYNDRKTTTKKTCLPCIIKRSHCVTHNRQKCSFPALNQTRVLLADCTQYNSSKLVYRLEGVHSMVAKQPKL